MTRHWHTKRTEKNASAPALSTRQLLLLILIITVVSHAAATIGYWKYSIDQFIVVAVTTLFILFCDNTLTTSTRRPHRLAWRLLAILFAGFGGLLLLATICSDLTWKYQRPDSRQCLIAGRGRVMICHHTFPVGTQFVPIFWTSSPDYRIGSRQTFYTTSKDRGIQQHAVQFSTAIPSAILLVLGIASWARSRRRLIKPGRCVQCDYDLRESISGICPECGLRFDFEHSQKPGEQND